jgi:hypothetical protein
LGVPDEWGTPTAAGYFRDDNSLVKGLPRTLEIQAGRNRIYRGAKLGNGFVAAHVWRVLTTDGLASRDPLTYSFVPNVVWLPSEVAALTDREGSFVQAYVQAVARKIYANVPVAPALAEVAEDAWALLPENASVPEQGLPAASDLNYFVPGGGWLATRLQRIRDVVEALDAAAASRPLPKAKVVSSRYTTGLSQLDPGAASALAERLRPFVTGGNLA